MIIRRGDPPICFDCQLLELKGDKKGRPFFWCVKRQGKIRDGLIWKRACRHFAPVLKGN